MRNSLDQSENHSQELMVALVTEFLEREMQVPRQIIENLAIVKVFPPASQHFGWSTLYAEFSDLNTSSLIQQYARNLQHGKRLSLYVPSSLQLRFSQINSLAHQIRNGSTKCKTRVKYGASDFVLLQKPRQGDHPWSYVSLGSPPSLQLTPSQPAPRPTDAVRKSTKRIHSGEDSEGRQNRPRLAPQTHENDVEFNARHETSEAIPAEHNLQPVQVNTSSDAASPTSLPPSSSENCSKPVDNGIFFPSACASPKGITNKNFDFTSTRSAIPRPLNLRVMTRNLPMIIDVFVFLALIIH